MNEEKRMMKADQILRIEHLRDKVAEASLKMRKKGSLASPDGQSSPGCMVQVLASAGYHQVQRIADAFGADFDEQFSNEYEWDRFWQEINDLRARLERELQGRLELPQGTFFCLGYDPGRNFGLILRSEETALGNGGEWMN
jgi:hypothetical protein